MPNQRVIRFVLLLLFVSLFIAETASAQMSPQQFASLEGVLRSSAVNRSVNLTPPDDPFPGSPLPNLAGVVRSLRGSSRSELVNTTVDKLLAEIPPLQQSGQKGEVRRRLLHAFTLLTAKAWTPQAEYGASLELRGAPSIIDLSKPLTAQLTQAFSAQPPSSSALQMRLRGSGRRLRRVRLGWDCRQHLARSECRRPVDHAGLHVLRMCIEVSTTRADEVVVDAQLDGLVLIQRSDIDVRIPDPQPGTYTLEANNYAGGSAQYDWSGSVTFEGPTPPSPTGTKEAWLLSCADKRGNVLATREVVVDRGETIDVGNACMRVKG